MKDYLIIGKLGGAHGVRGEVKVIPLTDDVRRFSSLKECMILDEKEHVKETRCVEKSRVDDTRTLIKFKGIDDRDEVAKLTGFYIGVKREDAVKLPEGRYFIADLIGITVSTDEGEELGKLTEVIQTGANDVYVVRNAGREYLLPAIRECVLAVDIGNGTMTVHEMPGLFS